MKFEIPLTETQRYVLKTTAGFSGLPHSFSQVDLKKSKDDNREIPELELPAWKREIQKRRQELDRLSEINLKNIEAFYTARIDLYNQCSEGKNWGEAAIAFRDALSPEDREKHERMFAESYKISEKQEKISRKSRAIYRKHTSKLLGIMGVAQFIMDSDGNMSSEIHTLRIIPPENIDSVKLAIESGIFSKELTSQDIEILNYINSSYNLNTRESYPETVSVTGISINLDLTDVNSVQGSFNRLSGLLCHLYIPKDYWVSYDRGIISTYCDRWFIPQARRSLIERICKQ